MQKIPRLQYYRQEFYTLLLSIFRENTLHHLQSRKKGTLQSAERPLVDQLVRVSCAVCFLCLFLSSFVSWLFVFYHSLIVTFFCDAGHVCVCVSGCVCVVAVVVMGW